MRLTKRAKLLLAVSVVLPVSVVVLTMLPTKAPITLTFSRYEDDGITAVLLFTKLSTADADCYWEGEWVRVSECDLSSPDPIMRSTTSEAKHGTLLASRGVNDVRVQRSSAFELRSSSSTLKI